MKLRNLSLLLFVVACGGGKDPNPVPVDSPTGDGGGFFPNSRNDVILVTYPADTGFTPILTPDEGDAPDNSAAVEMGLTGKKITGEMGIAGDHSDDYFERDTFLISTPANVNQLTVRMAWEGNSDDMDFALFAEPDVGATDLALFASGTLISDGQDDMGNPVNEFATFTVDPSRNYLLWGAVFNVLSAGGNPTLPANYDFSIFGANIQPTGNATECTAGLTEGPDNGMGNNNIEAFGGTGTREANNVTIAPGAPAVYCGSLGINKFLVNPEDATIGTDDVDAFEFDLATENDMLVTIIGETAADQTALNALAATGLLQVALFNDANPDADPNTAGAQPRPQQFFQSSEVTYLGSHGVTAFRMVPSSFTDPDLVTDVVGPKTLAIFLQSEAPGVLSGAGATAIKYHVKVEVDNRNTRAGRLGTAADLSEANDN